MAYNNTPWGECATRCNNIPWGEFAARCNNTCGVSATLVQVRTVEPATRRTEHV
jgi:hypothetical protein